MRKTLFEFKEINPVKEKNKLIVKGVFIECNKKNLNGRIYPLEVVKKEVERYKKEFIEKNNAVGELNHPKIEEVTNIDLTRVSHKIIDLYQVGDDFYGVAEILDTPCGKIVKKLIEGGVRLGVSSRGIGSTENVGGVERVKDDYTLITIDIVQHPSAPSAYINPIYESKKIIINNKGNNMNKRKEINIKERIKNLIDI